MNKIYEKNLQGAGMWSGVIRRGKVLKLTDLEGGANLGMMLYNHHERTERYNMPDTLKGQQVFYLTQGICLHTDMGRIIASIIKDTVGWHDTVCGTTDAAEVKAKYGEKTYQEAHNHWYRNGAECFLIELAKHGLGEKDWQPNVNFFSKVTSDEDGKLSFTEGNSKVGDFVCLRMEMDALVVMNICQHPLDPSPQYQPKPVLMEVFETVDPVAEDDECRCSHPENGRAFINTENYYKLGI
ncbi:urea amidolyase associated protein UAAP1 [Luteolibacter algae]|uniref:Urea amidolyase associated protein UAAP1 n=1 Tax=Luteolibacter algae TaxID=454151 RepID=A0ABW5D721_9BACT